MNNITIGDIWQSIRSSHLLKILLIGFLILLLQIPIARIRGVIRERQQTRDEAVQEVTAKWGSSQSIIGPMVTAEGIAPKAQELGIPIVTLTQKESIPQKGDYIFRNFITPVNQTRTLVAYGTRTLGIKRYAILYPSDKYGINNVVA